ncbi:MAG: PstS family phosphate ABC transporter substrate-binding protein [Alphaproteobacteria bacterium]|nr:PstS family phosphate ABC transporter substrate-binding protein [Alphaproteobacteria bacterium]
MKKTLLVAAAATLAMAGSALAQTRDQIKIVGSSTVFPFTTAVAEQFGKTTKFKAPIVESTGTGGGLKLFCAGVGANHPDFTNASRAIKKSEIDDCKKNGVAEVIEMTIGFDGIVLANSKQGPKVKITIAQLWKAMAREVPMGGKMVANPAKNWSDVDPSLPASKIEVLGPPPTSGTRDAFNELAMEAGCKKAGAEADMEKILGDKGKAAKACQAIREDGAFIEAGENDVLIVQKLVANKNAFGIFGYSFLEESQDKIQGASIDGVEPTYDNISSFKYPVARSLFLYAKKAHVGVIPGIKEFIAEYMSEKAMGEEGYLAKKGLIALPKEMREKSRSSATSLKPMS